MRSLMRVLSWNVGSLQTNPLEFWQPVGSAMREAQVKLDRVLLESKSVYMRDVFTESMLHDLVGNATVFRSIFSEIQSRSVHAFLTDPQIGHKRLVSMPDRVMREIPPFGTRPSVITGYAEPFLSMSDWWAKYLHFMRNVDPMTSVLRDYQKAKYGTSSVSNSEVEHYKEYQMVYLAATDAAFVHLSLQVQGLTDTIAEMNAVFTRKFQIIANILHAYNADVICLQEVDMSELRQDAFSNYHVIAPDNSSGKQDSVILLKRNVYDSPQPLSHELGGLGDLTLVRAMHKASERDMLIASYHGDTNGQSTLPTIRSMLSAVDEPVIIGTDANTHAKASSGKLSFAEFKSYADSIGLQLANPLGQATTMSVRTFFQAQSHKGAHALDVETASDPKDNIILSPEFGIEIGGTDFTGAKEPAPRLIPSDAFPSDHAIVWVDLELVAKRNEL